MGAKKMYNNPSLVFGDMFPLLWKEVEPKQSNCVAKLKRQKRAYRGAAGGIYRAGHGGTSFRIEWRP